LAITRPSPSPPSRVPSELDGVEQAIRQLRIEYEKYFNGALDLPPGEMQTELSQQIRGLRSRVKASVDRFRLQTLEAQFNTYLELFNRRLRDHEEGRSRGRRPVAAAPAYDPTQGVVYGLKPEEGAVAALYKSLYDGSSQGKKVDLESFRGYLDRQASMIRQKTGCADVQFRLTREDGKLKLKAKPLRGEANQ
jgi:hypothetical protein